MKDPYTYPNSRVMVNKANIRAPSAFTNFEYAASSTRQLELESNPTAIKELDFGVAHLQAIHAFLLQDVYSWAGQNRAVNIRKGTTDFAKVGDIDRLIGSAQQDLKQKNYLRGSIKTEFVQGMAETYKKLNDAHPFREGNGRSTRIFMSQLARQAGYRIDYGRVDQQQWIDAAVAASKGDLSKSKAVFAAITQPERAHAFETKTEHFALAKHPELIGAYAQLLSKSKTPRVMRDLLNDGHIPTGASPKASLTAIRLYAHTNHVSIGTGPRDLEQGRLAMNVLAKSEHHLLVSSTKGAAFILDSKFVSRDLNPGDRLYLDSGRSPTHDRDHTALHGSPSSAAVGISDGNAKQHKDIEIAMSR